MSTKQVCLPGPRPPAPSRFALRTWRLMNVSSPPVPSLQASQLHSFLPRSAPQHQNSIYRAEHDWDKPAVAPSLATGFVRQNRSGGSECGSYGSVLNYPGSDSRSTRRLGRPQCQPTARNRQTHPNPQSATTCASSPGAAAGQGWGQQARPNAISTRKRGTNNDLPSLARQAREVPCGSHTGVVKYAG